MPFRCISLTSATSPLLLLTVLVVSFLEPVSCKRSYQDRMPNGGRVPGHPAVGHKSATRGNGLNQFGRDYESHGGKWTKGYCNEDSDGDGQSNGLELGDPHCVWTRGATPQRLTLISDPSDPNSRTTASPSYSDAPATPSPPLTPAQSLPVVGRSAGLINVFSNRFSIGWNVLSTTTAEHHFEQQSGNAVLETTLVLRGDYYGGYGVAASKMTGPFVACYVKGTGSASCKDMLCDGAFVVTQRSPQVSTVVSASKNSTHSVVVVRTPASALGVTNGATLRVMFAVGPWDSASNAPLQHASSRDYTTAKINFYSGSAAVQSSKSRLDWLALGLGALGAFLLTLLAGIVNACGFIPTPRQRTIIWIATAIAITALIAMVWGISFAGYKRDGASSPVGRAFGNCVTYIFFLLMWPTTKHVGPVHVLGLAYEKVLIVHICLGVIVLLFMTVHFGVIWDSYASNGGQAAARDQILKWNWSREEPRSNLAGFLSWLFLVLMVLPAMLLRRPAYTVFRVTHTLFLFVLVFGALHHAPMVVLLSPPLFVYLIDVVLRIISHHVASPQIQSAVVHCELGSCKCPIAVTASVVEVQSEKDPAGSNRELGEPLLIELDVHLADFSLRPGQYAFLGVKRILSPNLHPFSIARFLPDSGNPAGALTGAGVVKFFIQPMGPMSWTARVAKLILSGDTLGGTILLGPYGRLQVPLEGNRRIFLVAAGVGITPMMSTLQYCVSRIVSKAGDAGESSPAFAELESITLIWVVRHHQVLNVIRPHLEGIVEPLANDASWKGSIQIVIHLTGSQSTEMTSGLPSEQQQACTDLRSPANGVSVVKGRPEFTTYFTKDIKRDYPHEVSERTGRSAVYACGSTSFIDAIETSLKPCPEFYLHTELFEF